MAIARQDLRILRTDSMPVLVLVIMPLILMPFLEPTWEAALRAEGNLQATGAEQVVPGVAVTFAFFLVGNVSFGFFREHAWKTWDRLRGSPASTAEIMLGKVVSPLLQAAIQFIVLFGIGGLLMGFDVRGSWMELIAVGAAFSLYLVATGLAVTAICRTFMQANAITNIGALLLAGLAGALVPHSLLPDWAQAISPAVPSYWAMEGYQHAVLGEGGGVLGPITALLAFSAGFAGLAALRFRFEEAKVGLI